MDSLLMSAPSVSIGLEIGTKFALERPSRATKPHSPLIREMHKASAGELSGEPEEMRSMGS
jgi:HAMP domain-containing protein